MTTPTNSDDRPAQATEPHERARGNGEFAPVLLTVSEAGQALAVGRTTVYELIRSGQLEVIRIGRSTRIPVDAIAAFVDRQRRQQRRATRAHALLAPRRTATFPATLSQ
jgi:excisionase family DNA binding protein